MRKWIKLALEQTKARVISIWNLFDCNLGYRDKGYISFLILFCFYATIITEVGIQSKVSTRQSHEGPLGGRGIVLLFV
jgi:hypothetical protein